MTSNEPTRTHGLLKQSPKPFPCGFIAGAGFLVLVTVAALLTGLVIQ